MTNREDIAFDEQQVIDLGTQASEALNNPIFRIEFEMIMARTIDAIDATPPEHHKEIMWQKQKREVLKELYRDFIGMIQHAEKVYADIQQRNSPENREKRRLDAQGFGLDYGKRGAQS